MAKSKEAQAGIEISQILAWAAHDLRQPVHSLDLQLAALAGRKVDAETAALVSSAQTSADGLSGIVEAILVLPPYT